MGIASAGAHRQLMSAFPTGVAVITVLGSDGRPWGLTCSSLVSVTLDPPTLLVCIGAGSPTLQEIRDAGCFGVNILNAGARHVAEVFSSSVSQRFDYVEWAIPVGARTPWLTADALGYAQCKLSGDMQVGDHAVLLGTVAMIRQVPGVPLLYGLRRFAAWIDASAVLMNPVP